MDTNRALKKIYDIYRTSFKDAQDIEIACDDECITLRKNFADSEPVYIFGRVVAGKPWLETHGYRCQNKNN